MDPLPGQYTEHEIRELIEHLAGDVHCPLCGECYAREGIRVAHQQETRWMLSIQCQCCGSGSRITAALPRDLQYSRSAGSELTLAEWRLFARAQRLSMDDVLDMREFLQEFQGDFSGLLSSAAGQA